MKRKHTPEEVARLMKGRLYYNPDDLNIIVRRSAPFSWTMNLGNPWSWGIMGLAVLGIASIVLLLS